MTKLFSILSLLCFVLAAQAQDTLPRTGNALNQDNTYRVLQQKYVYLAAGTDTVKPGAYYTFVTCSHMASNTSILLTTTNSFAGDIVQVVADSSTASTTLTILGPVEYAGPVTVATGGKRCSITLIFDGVAWLETARYPE